MIIPRIAGNGGGPGDSGSEAGMFFFIVGYGPRIRDLGAAGYRTCPRCGNHAMWRRIRSTNWVTLFFVPVLPTGSRTEIGCPVCGHAEPAT